TTDAADTSCAARTGSSACSQRGRAVSPVPNPVSPLTMPPASAPARRNASTFQSHRFSTITVPLPSGRLKCPCSTPYLHLQYNQCPRRGWDPRRPYGSATCLFGTSRPLEEGFAMSRMSLLSSPLLLGFEEMERLIDRVGKGGDGYPPYNIER